MKGGKYNELLVVLNFMHLGEVLGHDHNRILKQKKIEQENRRFMKPSSRNLHELVICNNNSIMIKCSHCGDFYMNMPTLKKHEREKYGGKIQNK